MSFMPYTDILGARKYRFHMHKKRKSQEVEESMKLGVTFFLHSIIIKTTIREVIIVKKWSITKLQISV